MKCLCRWLVMLAFVGMAGLNEGFAQRDTAQAQPGSAEQLFAMANQSRAQAGAPALKWDAALSEAALRHCMRMVSEGQIAHRYGGEADLTTRAADAGAHFSLIEENVAVGAFPQQIHEGWMNSPGHRTNLLNPDIDRVGIAVVAGRGVLYAVADYARGVEVMAPAQVESAVAGLIRKSGVKIRSDAHDARAACTMDRGLPRELKGGEPGFVMRWQGADLQHLPQQLVDRLGTGSYHEAAVGSCPARNTEGAFTAYRLAVLLY